MHIGVAAEAAIQRFVNDSLAAALHLHIGLSRHAAHAARKFIQRRGIDHMHRKRQRHAQHHRHHRRAIAPGVMAQFLPGKAGE